MISNGFFFTIYKIEEYPELLGKKEQLLKALQDEV